MGWNYYMERNHCPHCNRRDRVHIGKSSMGWVFALRRYRDEGVFDLDDWIRLWNEPGTLIVDEDGNEVSIQRMVSIISERSGPPNPGDPPAGFEIGPKNLIRQAGTLENRTWAMHADDDRFTEEGW
jgi:hypothetical protein